MMTTLVTLQQEKNKTLSVVWDQKLNKKFMLIFFFWNIGDLATLTNEQLDWKTRLNIALNAAQGKFFNSNMITIK
jgi:hypothetical protein